MGPLVKEKYNSIVNKYPTYRDDKFRGCWRYMEGRRNDDNAEGLWRVHDKLYDMTDFVEKHPGGRQWLILTKGTDITESFESHHITPKASMVLKKFYVREASKPRNYKFTFDENGFYKTLKRHVAKKLETIDVNEKSRKSKLILDLNLIALFVAVLLAVRSESTFARAFWTLLSGQFMAWSANFSHNFVHQKDNWRMYTASLPMISYRDFRVFHVMSHHMFPNSITDLEVTNFENHLKWLPVSVKSKLSIAYSYVISPFAWATVFSHVHINRMLGNIWSETKVWYWDEMISFIIPIFMMTFNKSALSASVVMIAFLHWILIVMLGSFLYTAFAVNNGHHGPEITHEGDEFDNLDFGIFQMAAIIDRQGIDDNLFTVLGYYGLHTLHHMFPTLDHAVLPLLEKTLIDTCKEFEIQLRKSTLSNAFEDQFKQLGRTVVRKLA